MTHLKSRLFSLLLFSLSISVLPTFTSSVIANTPRAVTLSDCSRVITGTLTETTIVSGGRCITTFLSGTGTWTPKPGVETANVLVVAGGGGGGSRHGGGGGAGGVVYASGFRISDSAISVVVGSGGLGSTSVSGGTGASGSNSTFLRNGNGLTALGGGGGGGVGQDGGSGGGSNFEGNHGGTTNQSSQTQRSLSGTTLSAGSNADGTLITNYGNNGGLGIQESVSDFCQRDWCGGGGGGGGAVGGNATRSGNGTSSSNGLPGNGGIGIVNPISGSTIGQLVSSSYYIAGGGGGASSDNGIVGIGGDGGGGAGGNNMIAAVAGTANTGGGGGGGGFANGFTTNPNGRTNQPGGNGGTGVVIISYVPDTTPPSRSSVTLLSTGNQIRLAYNETLATTAPALARFTVRENGDTRTISSLAFADSRTITLTLAPPVITRARTVTLSYDTATSGALSGAALIEDLALNDAVAFTNDPVTNNSSFLTRLDTPTTLAVSNIDTSSVTFSFTATANATNHKVVVYDSSTSAIVAGGSDYFFSGSPRTGLTPATRYYATLQAVGNGTTYESSTASAPVYFTTLIRKPVISSQPVSLSKTAGQSASFSVVATSPDAGTMTYQWQKNSSNISGETANTLSFASTSTSDAGTYSVIVTNTKNGVSDSTTSTSVTLNVASALSITTPLTGLTSAVDSAYTLSLVSSGGSGEKTFALATGSLPTGLSLASSTGIISGTPRAAGSNSLSIRVTDINSAMDTTSVFTISVSAANQTITFGSLSNRAFGSGNFTLSASDTTTSGLPIAYASSSLSTCTLSGADSRTVTLVAAGTCTITANQAGNANYNAAPQVQQSFTITKAQPAFDAWTAITKTYGDAPFPITAPTLTSIISGTLTYTSSDVSVVSISGVTLTVEGGGTVTITALFTPSDISNYETAITTTTITVNRASQLALSITSTTVAFGENLTVVTTGGSGSGSVTLTKVSGNCTVSGITLTPTSTGSCDITATKSSDDNYLAETSTVTTITITTGSATATISFTSLTFTFGVTNPITVTTSVAGKVRFLVNNKVIKNCKARSTTLTGPFTATCSYKPDTRRPLTITAVLTPTDTRYATRTSASGTFLVARRTGARG